VYTGKDALRAGYDKFLVMLNTPGRNGEHIKKPRRPALATEKVRHVGDAVAMVDAGYATPQDVDTAMTAGCGYPRGLFAILDDLGADVVADGLLEQGSVDPTVVPNPLLVEHAVRDLPFLD
jgi:3-hydroxybutyryl-CoA dehydrogenase